MSVNDLATLGHSIGFAPTLVNPKAWIGNAANQYKVGRYVDLTTTAGSGVYGASGLMTGAQLNSEFLSNPDAAHAGYNITPAENTCSNTCPIMINYHSNATAGNGIVPAITTKIVARTPILLHYLNVSI
jgi:hypothetical protein